MRITTSVLAVLAVVVFAGAQLWTEIAWFDQIGYSVVWQVEWGTRAVLFAVFGLIAAALVWGTLRWARAVRPAPQTGRRTPLDAYREQIRPIENVVTAVLPAVIGVIAGLSMSAQWATVQAFLNRTSFGYEDPQFGLDASFYVFTLPVLQSLLGFALAMSVLTAVIAAFLHLLYGGISGGGRSFVASKGARTQLGIAGAVVMLVIAASYVLQRYTAVLNTGESFSGATYTDVNAALPARAILAGIAVIVAAMFLMVLWRGDWRIPVTGVGLMVLSALVVGGIYPSVVQQFQVEPNAQEYEAPYIQRNIDATLVAYGLEDVETIPYDAATVADANALRADADTTTQIRLLDPNVVAPTFRQLQQNKQYYNFPDTLTVDRYEIDGELADTVIAVRGLDLSGLSAENRSWVTDHTVYTHGFGVVAAYGSKVASDGRPAFFQSGIPSVGALGEYEPRIYFGDSLPDYSIVGAPEGSEPWELDFPDDASGGQVNTTFPTQEFSAGPSIGNFFAKVMYALKFGEQQILFSDRVTSESQILYYRDPLERVGKVAPYLTLDSTVYPAVVDGRVVWIVDGYTMTQNFPYSASISTPVLFEGSTSLEPTELNYIRNSVKATVDAYDGSVTLYAWDPEDPILKTWSQVYGNTLVPYTEMSSDLMSHMRYPEDLFEVQRYQLTRYHVTNAAEFFSGSDFWSNPVDPTDEDRLQPPYYLTMQMPGQGEPTFSLTSTFIPSGTEARQVLTGFLAVNSETGSEAGKKSEDYGTLRLLELPRDTTVSGPGQVQNQFRTDPEAQNVLNLLRQGETAVISGNLLTLPVGGGLLYVQPVYVRSSQGTQFPLLQKVFVSFGDQVGFADTLSEALDQVFGEGAAVTEESIGTDGATPTPSPTPSQEPEPSASPEPSPSPSEEPVVGDDLAQALADAQKALEDGQAALAEGDFAAYGEAQDRLEEALTRAIAAQAASGN